MGVSRRKRGLIEREMADFKMRADRQRQYAADRKSKQSKLYENIMQKISQRALDKKKAMTIDVDRFSQIDSWFTDEKTSEKSSIISENDGFVEYEPYLEQPANDSKDGDSEEVALTHSHLLCLEPAPKLPWLWTPPPPPPSPLPILT